MKTTLSPSMAWRDLQEIIDPDARREQARELYEYTDKRDAALGTEDDSLTSVHGALARHPGSHPRARLQLSGIVTLAVLLAVLDTPLQGVLNLEQFPSVPHWIWWIVAPALAAGGTFFTHGAAIAFLHDELRPARSLRLCRTLAWTFFVLVMLAASVLLYTRVVSADGAESILGLTTVCLWIVTEALPLAAGLFAAWAYFLGEPTRVARRLTSVKQEREALARFKDKLTGEIADAVPSGGLVGLASTTSSPLAAAAPPLRGDHRHLSTS